MTDAEKLREVAKWFQGKVKLPVYPEDQVRYLNDVADLLDAVPPKTFRALADKTWRAVPVEPTVEMTNAIYENTAGETPATKRAWYNAVAVAPAKPEG